MENYEEILTRMKTKFAELSGITLKDDSDVGIRMKLLAGEILSLQRNVQWLKNQMFAQTASGTQLEYIAASRGITRKPATTSVGTLTFGRDTALNYDVEIPAGTVCSTSEAEPIRVKTTQTATLTAGMLSVTVPAQSEGGGSAQNTGIGSVKVMVTPPAAITSVTNEDAFTGGIDAESDEELRERIIESYKNISNGANSAFYKEQVLKHDEIYSASVGTVDIYVASRGGVPDDSVVTQLQTEITELRELNVDVQVKKADTIEVAVGVDISVKDGYSFDEIKQQCIDNIINYFNTLKIGEPCLVAAIGNAVYTVPGVENYYIVSSISTDRYMSETQLAVIGSIQISER